MMKLSFSTLGCPNWDIKKIVDSAPKYGYEGGIKRAGRQHISPEVSPLERKEIKNLLKRRD